MRIQKVSIMSRLVCVLVLLAWLTTCAINPVTGKRELMLLSETDEIQLGKESDQGIVQTYGVYPDQGLHDYINTIGQEMAKISHRPNLTYEFKVMDNPVINAFAVPGGYVYITRGILAYLNNEAELAGVVGHEIGHVTARHSAEQYTRAQLAQLGLGVGAALSKEIAQYAGLASQGIGLLFLKFSRDNERQADDLGVEYSTKVGYDAREMANLFKTLVRMQGNVSERGLPNWFSTHPDPADRVVSVQKDAVNLQTKMGLSNLKINREEFLNKLPGLVYGDDPRQGYMEGNIFYHPGLKFSFPIPSGWKTSNMPTQVQMASSDEKAAILFSLADESTPQAAVSQFINKYQAQVQSQNNLKINGMDAVQVVSLLSGQTQPLQVMSCFIAKDKQVFVFHGFSSQTDFNQYQNNFRTTMQGFANLSDPARLNVKPDRLQIKRITTATTLQQALKANGVADKYLEEHALINGLNLDSALPANTLIKVIERGK